MNRAKQADNSLVRLRLMAVSARMTVSRSPGPNVASARSVSLSVSAAITPSRERPRSVSTSRTSRRSPLAHLRELAAVGIDHALASPRTSWDEATFEAIASILPEVHAIEPETI